MNDKKFYIPREQIKDILTDWNGAVGCLATDKITVDGHKVGYCYREEPDGDWDSGWRFLAGDESDEYVNDPDNTGIYELNTICNYDPDILKILYSPYNTAYGRDESGKFVEEDFFQPEE